MTSPRARFRVCGEQPCRALLPIDPTTDLRRLASDDLSVETVDCLGHCSHAPLVAVSAGPRTELFADVGECDAWEAICTVARRAAAAGTLLVDYGDAQALRFDPVHDRHDHAVEPEPVLKFLTGHFAGEGRYPGRSGSFRKEVVGTWEANGRFVLLRMAVGYALGDGRVDEHAAMVVVGRNAATGAIEARAFTDGGSIVDYPFTIESDGVVWFPDRMPGHRGGPGARKVLRPSVDGYDEELHVPADDGGFRVYSVVQLRRESDHRGGR